MTPILRLIASVALSLALVLTAQGAAVARGATPAEARITLCIGLGTAVVWVDEDGNPTSAPHLCPNALLAMMQALPPVDTLPVRAMVLAPLDPAVDVALPRRAPTLPLRARAPPVA